MFGKAAVSWQGERIAWIMFFTAVVSQVLTAGPLYPCPEEVFMHKRWSSAGRQSRRQSEAEQTDRLARAKIGLRWAKSLVLSETLYISTIGLCCFSQRVQQIRTQRLTSAFGVINLPHSCHSIPVVVVNFVCAYGYIYEFGRWFYPKWLTFKVKKKNRFMGSLGIKPIFCIVSWDQIWNATIVLLSILFLHIFGLYIGCIPLKHNQTFI